MGAGASGPLGPIQVIPPGLIGLLQLKQFGRLPDKLGDQVAPVVELRDWYMTARRVNEIVLLPGLANIALVTGDIGFQPFAAVVPGNQIWYVEEMTIKCSPTGAEVATDAVRFACGLVAPVASINQVVGPDVSDYTLAARARDIRARSDRGFWAFPGDTFAVCVFDILTTNGYTFGLGLRATPCPI